MTHPSRHLSLLAAALLSGCASFSPDGGMSVVSSIAGGELRKEVVAIRTPEEAVAARARMAHLLRGRVSADRAVQIALLNNRGLQAAYNALGLAEAEMVQASLPPNPTFSIERLSSPLELEIERRIVANILSLATLPARAEIAADRFHQSQLRAAEETLRIALEARRAYYRAVAARQSVSLLTEAKSTAEAAAQLSRRLGEIGTLNKLDQAREQVFYAEITAQLATARQRATSERERLIRVLGLWGAELEFGLPGTLPPLPGRPRALPGIEVEAIGRRVDLQVARLEIEALAKSYGLTGATRFLNLLEVTGIAKDLKDRETGGRDRPRGFEVEFQVPLFDFGESRVRQAQQIYLQAVNRLAEKAVNVRSEARDAYRVYRSTYDIAAHYRREVLPLRKIISDEMLLRYNAMQIDVFTLLTEARQRMMSNIAAIEAQRDFWLAKTDLLAATVGGGSSTATSETSRAPTAAVQNGAH
jgi:outer membrane protein TolC